MGVRASRLAKRRAEVVSRRTLLHEGGRTRRGDDAGAVVARVAVGAEREDHLGLAVAPGEEDGAVRGPPAHELGQEGDPAGLIATRDPRVAPERRERVSGAVARVLGEHRLDAQDAGQALRAPLCADLLDARVEEPPEVARTSSSVMWS
jgi:hypothetical protein